MAGITHHFSYFFKPEVKTETKVNDEAEREILSQFNGLGTAYKLSQNRSNDLKQREKRQTSEFCRVLCLSLMLLFIVIWIGQCTGLGDSYWFAKSLKDVFGGQTFHAIDSEASMNTWLKESVQSSLFPEGSGSLPVGKMCIVEYYSKSQIC